MKTLLKVSLLITLFSFFLFFSACKPEKTEPQNDAEVITTLICTFTDSLTGAEVGKFRFADPDGDGGLNPITDDTLKLNSGMTYLVSLAFLDETQNPVADITSEIEEEGEEHQIFFQPEALNGLIISYLDADVDGKPVGIRTLWNTMGPQSGFVRIFLKHQPGVKNGNPLDGDTDFDHTFVCEIE